jgi:hypothetical protein
MMENLSREAKGKVSNSNRRFGLRIVEKDRRINLCSLKLKKRSKKSKLKIK